MASRRVAVVVPIYNVEKYLSECLLSLETQSIWDDVDVVLVDDGSTDGSSRIAQEFASRFSQVTLIRQENQGQGVARNRGLAEVAAPYVTFLDADDRLPARALEHLRDGLVRRRADISVGNMESFPVARKWRWQSALEAPGVLTSLSERPALIRSASVCNKMFHTSTFEGGRLFGEGVAFEDAYVSIPRMLEAHRIVVTGEVTYHYRKRADDTSTMDSLFTREKNFWDHLLLAEHLAAAVADSSEENQELVLRYNIETLLGFVARSVEVFGGEDLSDFYRRCRSVIGHAPPEVLRSAATNLMLAKAALALRNCAEANGLVEAMRSDELFVHGRRVWLKPRANRADPTDLQSPEAAAVPSLEDAEALAVPVDRWRVLVEGIDTARDRRLRVHGRVIVPGLRLNRQQERLVPVLRIGKSRFVGGWAPRMLDGRDADQDWSYWTVDVPSKKLRSGTFNLSLLLRDVDGEGVARKIAVPTRGALRSARMLRLRKLRAVLHYQRPRLQIEVAAGRSARSSMRRRLLRLDLQAILGRQPMSSLRFARLVTRSLAGRRPVVLYGERGDTAQDNGFVQFTYAREHEERTRSYFVIDGHVARSLGLGGLRSGIVRRDSLAHKFLMLHARVMVSSYDFDAYMLPRAWDANEYRRHLAWRIGARRVFLQHGVIINGVGVPLGRGTTGLARFICSSSSERSYLEATTGYSRELVTTGLPRFDLLSRAPGDKPLIALMPTWRKYLVARSYVPGEEDPGTFPESRYEEFYTALLQSGKLAAMLEEYDASLVLMPHYEVHDHLATIELASDRIEVCRGEGSAIPDLITRATMCVTDFSSVVFDAALIGVPVIHMPFDEEDFYERHYPRGWFDVEEHGVGPVCRDVDEVIDAIQHYLGADGVREPEFDERTSRFFDFTEQGSREAVHREVEKLVGG